MEWREYPRVGPSLIQQVNLCALFRRAESGYRGTATSLPGHLLQLTIAGSVQHEINGRTQQLSPGSLMWFHEDEWVRVQVLRGPWEFYSFNFLAPGLAPPPADERLRRVGRRVRQRFAELLAAWRDLTLAQPIRQFRVHACACSLLAEIHSGPAPAAGPVQPTGDLWWDLETQLRRDLSQKITLTSMTRLTGRSAATIARSCRQAAGLPPLKRIKQIRLSLAAGMVRYSDLCFSEIAARVGYSRVHEFSRDYHKHLGLTPTQDRQGHLPK